MACRKPSATCYACCGGENETYYMLMGCMCSSQGELAHDDASLLSIFGGVTYFCKE